LKPPAPQNGTGPLPSSEPNLALAVRTALVAPGDQILRDTIDTVAVALVGKGHKLCHCDGLPSEAQATLSPLPPLRT